MSRSRFLISGLALATCIAAGTAGAHGSHTHGLATLQVAVDGETLTVNLSSPLDNLLGFERPPRSAAERDAVADMARRLRQADKLLLPSAAARCTLLDVRLEAPVLAGTPGHEGAAPASAASGEHGDMQARYRFRCANPAELRSLEARFFESFRRLGTINAQVVGPKRQSAGRLSAKKPALAL